MSADIETAKWAGDNVRWVYERIKEIKGWLQTSRQGARNGPRKILLAGPGGVGKSTFARIFSQQFSFLTDAPALYRESLDAESFSLAGEESVAFLVLPGQRHRRESTWPAFLQRAADGEFRGMLLFSSFGHQSLGELFVPQPHHALFPAAGRRKHQFVKLWLEQQRQEELHILRDLTSCLSACRDPFWLLSIVTKQDLWWNQRRNVEAHYREGEYEHLLHEIDRTRGSGFRRELICCALHIRNLVSSEGDILKKTTAGYDDALMAQSMRRLIEALDVLMRWENRR